MLAARWAGYPLHTFLDLEGSDQAVTIAAYRIQMYAQAVAARHDRVK